MNKILVILLMFAVNMAFTQSKDPAKTNDILRKVEVMNADADYTTKTLNTQEFLQGMPSGTSGQLIGYFKGRQVEKITARIAMTNCILNEKFYLQNDSLIMFYCQERDFASDENNQSAGPLHAMTGMECRYYYNGHQLLKTDLKGAPKCADKPSDKQAEEMINTCQRYVKLLKK